MQENNKIIINGIIYIPEQQYNKEKPYYIVRTYSAGVFACNIDSKELKDGFFHVKMANVRRIWYWKGAASLSQMSISGVKEPKECKFSVITNNHEVSNGIEIIECTKEAEKNIKEVHIWEI